MAEFRADQPQIQRGLYDLIAAIFEVLPTVVPQDPERMIGFSTWLAAMEVVRGVPEGVYQSAYASAVRDGLRDSLFDNPVGATVLDFMKRHKDDEWRGSPHELFRELTTFAQGGVTNARDWPDSHIALGKQLRPLQVALHRQGLELRFGRSRDRWISIRRTASFYHD